MADEQRDISINSLKNLELRNTEKVYNKRVRTEGILKFIAGYGQRNVPFDILQGWWLRTFNLSLQTFELDMKTLKQTEEVIIKEVKTVSIPNIDVANQLKLQVAKEVSRESMVIDRVLEQAQAQQQPPPQSPQPKEQEQPQRPKFLKPRFDDDDISPIEY